MAGFGTMRGPTGRLPVSDDEQSKRADDSTDPREIVREQVGSERQTIPLPTQDPTPEVVEEGSNPVIRWIRRLRGR
jgi:hypothetical protein